MMATVRHPFKLHNKTSEKTYTYPTLEKAMKDARDYSRLDVVGEVYEDTAKRGVSKWKMLYWFDSTGIYPAESTGRFIDRLENPIMKKPAAKKRASPAQIASRELFAERARAGKFKGTHKTKRAKAASVSRAVAKVERVARKSNPSPKRVSVRARAEKDPHLYVVWDVSPSGELRHDIAKFRKISDAKTYAQAYADQYKTQLAITSKKL